MKKSVTRIPGKPVKRFESGNAGRRQTLPEGRSLIVGQRRAFDQCPECCISGLRKVGGKFDSKRSFFI